MKFITLILLFSLLLVTTPFSIAQTAQESLTNDSIIQLTKTGLSPEAIIEKIKLSKTNFDLTTQALGDLKSAGVADTVIVQMLLGNASPTIETNLSANEILIPDGTEVEVEMKNSLSGDEAKVGDLVDLTVIKDIEINGIKVILKGSSATARIMLAKRAGYWGKKGQLEWAMQDVSTIYGRIPARFTKKVIGDTRSGTVAVGAIVTGVLLLPIAPVALLWGFKKGKKAIIPAGTKFSVYTDKDSTIKIKN